VPEEVRKATFIMGLNDAIKTHVRMAKPTSYETAVAKAKEVEEALSTDRPYQRTRGDDNERREDTNRNFKTGGPRRFDTPRNDPTQRTRTWNTEAARSGNRQESFAARNTQDWRGKERQVRPTSGPTGGFQPRDTRTPITQDFVNNQRISAQRPIGNRDLNHAAEIRSTQAAMSGTPPPNTTNNRFINNRPQFNTQGSDNNVDAVTKRMGSLSINRFGQRNDTGVQRMTCYNCGQRGHLRNDCPFQ
jgi:hypothetical protein